ncbi:MAG TPA: NAD-glutamate dehydrogenase, partial [Cellvibrionaceae bacterium]|nr:NAD-glutamate dehydrogenase [Cellvibrionaceae bacterium]
MPPEDWRDRDACDGGALLLALWQQVQRPVGDERRLLQMNEAVSSLGAQPAGSMILVMQTDRPFLVDSLRLAFTRLRLPIYLLKNAVFTPQWGADGNLTALQGAGLKQSFIYIETRHLTPQEQQALWLDLGEVFDDIAVMVADYTAITEQLAQLEQQLAFAPVAADWVSEAQAFIHWLKAGHFTFLGLRQFNLHGEGDNRVLIEDDAARLGVFRHIAPSKGGQWGAGMEHFYRQEELIAFSKSSTRCRVHRLVYPDYVVVKVFNAQGDICGEVRILGLFTYPVYTLNPWEIPLVDRKVSTILERANFDASSYLGKQLQRVIENYPRDELFQANLDELTETILGVARINERRVVRLFFRFDEFGRFATVVAYIPRDVYNTQLRVNMETLLGAALKSQALDSTTAFSESILARAFMVFRLGADSPKSVDCAALEEAVRQLARPWEEELIEVISGQMAQASILIEQFSQAFSPAYQASFTP